MASWFEKGRPALREALEKICTQIDADITADLRSSDDAQELADCRSQLQQSASRNRALEQENLSLRAELDKLGHISAVGSLEPLPSPSSSMPNGGLESSDPEVAQRIEFAKLAQRFRLLNENFRKARGALERRKAERDAWKRRFETLQEQIQADESEHGVEISSRASAALAAIQPLNVSFSASFSSTADPNDAVPETEEPQLPPMASKLWTLSRPAATDIGPLDSTQGESEGIELPCLPDATELPSDPPVKKEPSSDGPVVISERPVKKRRSDARTTATRAPVTVKTEPREDSSPMLEKPAGSPSQDSLDLGHTTHMTTPRKPREAESTPRVPPIYNIPHVDASALATPVAGYVQGAMPVPQTARANIMSSALTPISINRRLVRSGGDKAINLLRKRQLDEGIADIADDGTSIRTGQENNTPLRHEKNRNRTPKNRLEQLLCQGEAEDSPELSRLSRQAHKGPSISTAELNIPERRELPFEKQARQSRQSILPAVPATAAQATHRSPQRSLQRPAGQGQLRQKTARELRLDDFRINPAANEGHDFAYSDVVRDKDTRACLPGCTEMHCCGKQFRALAISQRPDPPLTAAQRMEEQTLLEQYLGDYAYRLATMDPAERAETWIQAKTQELANKYGRHRHRYSRMQSPPGFWDADFPNTQELEMGREEAAEREKRAIRERYREAMKPGGRWLFKDE
ncbi:DNA repair protein Sae2/CtIP [Cordyceps fumosorosea ARSEF 2679]|uniref:DNA repair protein Sae2/CtIP n=1 Tax=Cordyceps fumosorosea (strain ARSEF 2679) TaxID=1081104 RepID=A0A162M9V9_CORFA|nr:DNA repair protein Sae2/CtIP [Cordyceps fumosorosea ARSEF 2679]OAA53100.1 DNA repair protein Sae2/CtIP [Cordyceps fumosorosea ARSEF 2679]